MLKLKTFCALISVCLFFSCNSNQDEKVKTPPENEVTDTVASENSVDSSRTIVNHSLIWTIERQGNEKEKLKAPDSTQAANYSSAQLIDLLNQNYPDVQLNLIKISHDTIYVKIPDSKKLTNELGDTGAEDYLASATYTLTETKNIHFVNINMKAGDHAEPGVYSRDDFKSLR
jgi:hypothetical protein